MSVTRIRSRKLLEAIFCCKRNFKKGFEAPKRIFHGVEIAPYKHSASAAATISADFELNWAWRGVLDQEGCDERGWRERNNFQFLLKLFNDYSIPITWATVGHLFLSSCKHDEAGIAHASMPRPARNDRWLGDWYKHDPCTDLQKDPLWYAPDLIGQILASKVAHEIGTHSFSHIDFSTDFSSSELVKHEIQACKDVMLPFGVEPESLVFPFNRMGYSHLDVLSELGIKAVRHRDAVIRLSYPERTRQGVYKIYESMNLRRPQHYDYLDKAAIFIDKAIQRNAVYHLWFHPSDPIEILQNELRRIMHYIRDLSDQGKLWVTTMKELAHYCEARRNLTLDVIADGNQKKIFLHMPKTKMRYEDTQITLVIPCEHPPTSICFSTEDLPGAHHLIENPSRNDTRALVVTLPVSAKSLTITYPG